MIALAIARRTSSWGAAALTLAVAGCASSGAQQVGPDTYLVSARVPFTGETGAKADALASANRQCAGLGRKLLLQTLASNECALHGGCGEAQATFLCLTESDPRYHASATPSPGR